MKNIKHIIEALLFVAEVPLTINDIKKALFHEETGEIHDALNELREDYNTRMGGFYLNEVAGGYQLRTRPDYNEYIKRLLQPKPLRMSKAALETLAIVAYKQPAIRSDIEHIRGVDSGGILRMLLERKLIRILGRRKIPGRPLIYATTKLFLEVFDLKNLKELPTPKEIEALEDEASDSDNPQEGYIADPNQMQLFEPEEPNKQEDIADVNGRQIHDDADQADIQAEETLEELSSENDADLKDSEDTDFNEVHEDKNQYTEDSQTVLTEGDVDSANDGVDRVPESEEYGEAPDANSGDDDSDSDEDQKTPEF